MTEHESVVAEIAESSTTFLTRMLKMINGRQPLKAGEQKLQTAIEAELAKRVAAAV